MPVDPSLLELMPHTLQWKKKSGQDRWQKPTFAAAVNVRGLVVEDEHQVTDANGVKRIARGRVYLDDVYGITGADMLDWADGDVGDIIQVEQFYDDHGPYGSVVHYG